MLTCDTSVIEYCRAVSRGYVTQKLRELISGPCVRTSYDDPGSPSDEHEFSAQGDPAPPVAPDGGVSGAPATAPDVGTPSANPHALDTPTGAPGAPCVTHDGAPGDPDASSHPEIQRTILSSVSFS